MFVPGIDLNRGFYRDAVAPLLSCEHSAAHIGFGSDVLGYDTERSTDHGWGPRLQVFVAAADVGTTRAAVDAGLPREYAGWPVRFGWDDVAVTHHVYVGTLDAWLTSWLGYDASRRLTPLDWLVTPQQKLLEVIGGAVYHDGLGTLRPVRAALQEYPDAVWRWALACQWQRISQEEPFSGRAAEVGDELGSRVAAARMVREIMRLHFLYLRTYWPYTKWFGTAYARLPDAFPLAETVAATTYAERERGLVSAWQHLANIHNALGLTRPIDPHCRPFHGRPFQVIDGARFTSALLETVDDPWLRGLPPVGLIDQVVDSVDVLSGPAQFNALRTFYEQHCGRPAF
jgi:hypothetical protein